MRLDSLSNPFITVEVVTKNSWQSSGVLIWNGSIMKVDENIEKKNTR